MTNDNNTRKKANAVFFAVIMVVSMVAVGFAAAPAAAADTDGDNVTIEYNVPTDGQTIAQGTEVAPSVTVSVDGDDATNNFNATNIAEGDELVFQVDQGSGFASVDSIAFTDGNFNIAPGESEEYEFTGAATAIGNLDVGSYDHRVVLNNSSTGVVSAGGNDYASAEQTLNVEDGYVPSNPFQGQEVTFYNSSIDSTENYDLRRVTASEGGSVTNSQFVEEVSPENDGQIVIDTSDLETGDYFVRGPDLPSQPSLDNTFEVRLMTLDTEFEDDTVAADDSADIEIDSNRGSYALNVSADGDLDADELEALFTEEFDVTTVDDDEDRITIEGVTDDTYSANFSNVSDISTGNYEFLFESTDTEAEDTTSIEVTEAGEGELGLDEQIVTEQQGDVAAITVTFDDTEEGHLVIGDEENVGYQANVTIDSDGEDEVTVLFNTYVAGNTSSDYADDLFEIADDDSDASLSSPQQNEIGDGLSILGTGDYDLSIRSTTDADYGETLENPDTIGTLVIEDRETVGQTIWTASSDTVDDVRDADSDDDDAIAELTSQIENDAVTQTDTVAEGDYVIHQVEASGLTGLLANVSDNPSDALDALVSNQNGIDDQASLSLRVRQTADTTTTNAERKVLNVLDAADTEVYEDEDSDNLYIVYDLDQVETDGERTAEDGDAFDARFRVQDERLLDVDEDDRDELTTTELRNNYYQSVTASFSVEEREFEFDQDPYNVTNAEGQVVEGTSNVAPGSEVNLRVRSASGTSPSFIKTQEDVAVTADGTWSTEFDFSPQNIGDEYTITVRQSGLDDNPDVDGTVVEAVEEETEETEEPETEEPETEEPETEEPETEEPETEEPETEETEEETEETEDDTPGFGAVVALVALLAAALLATRRRP
ncbi:BGTF surface domain-containing protein [Halorubrum sp. DTA98]|uniref:DUF7827 domain-containing protein n=1 Tax=Halorubrum sp. DTA98 TaxID=3402163 RepID=UPI003AAF884B